MQLADKIPEVNNKGIGVLHVFVQRIITANDLLRPVYPVPEIHEPRHCPHVWRQQPGFVSKMILKPDLAEFPGKGHELRIFSIYVPHAVAKCVTYVQMMEDTGILVTSWSALKPSTSRSFSLLIVMLSSMITPYF